MNAEAKRVGFIGADPATLQLFRELKNYANKSFSVLLYGETGVGKEVAAQALHRLGARQSRAFVALNCAALPEALAESELFGHERGAFTGAVQSRPGAFEQAHGGTLFLDELGELSLSVQAKLLRALEAKEVRRVGADTTRSFDVRVIAATHRDLRQEMQRGRFREDLYYRLVVGEVRLPALRDRLGDLEALSRHFLEQFASEDGPRTLSPEALQKLACYRWPGNVRELRNVLQRAVAHSEGSIIGPEAIRIESTMGRSPTEGARAADSRPLRQVDRDALLAALERNQWNRRETARALGIARSTVKEKIKRYSLEPAAP